MARKPKSTPATLPKNDDVKQVYKCDDNADWLGFVNIRLDDDAKEAFDAWLHDNAAYVTGWLDDLLTSGMKASFTYDAGNSCYIASFTGALLSPLPQRCATTSRAGSLSEVIALMVYKHYVVAEGNYGQFYANGRTTPTWG